MSGRTLSRFWVLYYNIKNKEAKQPVAFSLRGELYWKYTKSKKIFGGCLELSPTGVQLIHIIFILVKTSNDPSSPVWMYLHSLFQVFSYHLSTAFV